MAVVKDLRTLQFPDKETANWFRQSLVTSFSDLESSRKRQLSTLAIRTAPRNAARARRGTLPCLTYFTTFDAGGAAIEDGVWDEAATGALFRNFFSGMS